MRELLGVGGLADRWTEQVGQHVTQVIDNATRLGQARPQGPVRRVGAEVAKFGTVGAAAFVIDVGLFNILSTWALPDSPLTAKGISVIVATTFAFLANRHWTYRDRARTGYRRETVMFFGTNAAALLISWTCLAFTHYLLGLDSQLMDNLSANILGVGLGTMFRFWAYRTWVFPEQEAPEQDAAGQDAAKLPVSSAVD